MQNVRSITRPSEVALFVALFVAIALLHSPVPRAFFMNDTTCTQLQTQMDRTVVVNDFEAAG